MNISKLNNQTIPIYKQLLLIGLPSRIISQAMGVNRATVEKYFKSETLNSQDYEIVQGQPAAQLRMLELYSSWISDPDAFALLAAGTEHDLLHILWKELDLEDFITFITGVLNTAAYFGTPTFEEGIPDREQELFTDMFFYGSSKLKASRVASKEILKEIMLALHKEKLPFPSAREFTHRILWYGRITQSLVHDYKKSVAPFISVAVRDRVKKILQDLSEGNNYPTNLRVKAIETHYKVGWATKLHDYEVSEAVERKNRTEGLEHLHRRAYKFIAPLRAHQEITLKMVAEQENADERIGKLMQANRALEEKLLLQHSHIEFLKSKAKLSIDDRRFLGEGVSDARISDGTFVAVLKMYVEDLELSTRAYNCIKAAKINTVFELVQFKTDQLLEFRNFGKKSLVEIEAVLHQKGLSFGMQFSSNDIDTIFGGAGNN